MERLRWDATGKEALGCGAALPPRLTGAPAPAVRRHYTCVELSSATPLPVVRVIRRSITSMPLWGRQGRAGEGGRVWVEGWVGSTA